MVLRMLGEEQESHQPRGKANTTGQADPGFLSWEGAPGVLTLTGVFTVTGSKLGVLSSVYTAIRCHPQLQKSPECSFLCLLEAGWLSALPRHLRVSCLRSALVNKHRALLLPSSPDVVFATLSFPLLPVWVPVPVSLSL